MSDQVTSQDMHNVISSLASVSGLTHYDLPVGAMTAEFGPALARVNHSASQAKALGYLTSGTYGPPGSTSSRSAALMLSLASRLKQRSATAGSTLFKLTWKALVTPAGRPFSLLRASVRRTAATDFGSSRTPWPTPVSNDGASEKTMRGGSTRLKMLGAARLAGWVTSSAWDWKDTPGMSTTGLNPDGSTRTRLDQLPRQAQLMDSGPTPTGSPAPTAKRGQLNPSLSRFLMGLPPAWCLCAPASIPKRKK